MMDLSFTKDPSWIAQRESEWKEIEGSIREGSTKKEVLAIKNYFMDGQKPNAIIGVSSIIKFFPVCTLEGIQYCLANYVPASITDQEYKLIQQVFVLMNIVANASLVEKKEMFEFIFGSKYEEGRMFPFLIGSENVNRLITIEPSYFLEAGLSVSLYIKTNELAEKSHWVFLQDFLFSLLPNLNVEVFDKAIIRKKLETIMTSCFCLLNQSESPEGDKERITYLIEFRSRMDALEEPVELKKIWEYIKAKYQ